ncbi:MAG: RluA family pseudouridine synthase, partial [Clostridiales bacterium]|nr:RluA family pseudouridine synthase [Clostridiales bacterium]
MGSELQALVSINDINKRLDIFVSEKIPGKSRSAVQKYIDGGLVSVDGKCGKANYRVKMGDNISVIVPEAKELNVLKEDIELDIVYEDGDVILINKPQNMVVHPAPGHYEGTLVNALLNHCGGSLSGINGVLRPGIVHRIDKDTSGVLIAAKNDMAHNSLAKQLQEHSMSRKYYALVFGGIKEDSGVIEKPIGRDPKERKRMAVNYKNGKPAITNFNVLDRFDGYTLVELILKTGRTHQIRVHMSDYGHP